MRTCEVICDKCQVIRFYKLHLCSLASSSQQQDNNNIIFIVIIIIIIIIFTSLEPTVDEMGRKAVWISFGRGVWRCVFGRIFPDGSKDVFGKWNLQHLHWENLKYRETLGVLRETSHFIEDTFTTDSQ